MDWAQLLVASVVSFLLGIVASVAAWWFITLRLRPSLEISREIAKTPHAKTPLGYVYRVKLRNPSPKRYVADVVVDARLRLEGSHPEQPGNSFLLVVPVGPGRTYPAMGPLTERTLRLHIENLEGSSIERLPAGLRSRLSEGSVMLEELLSIDDIKSTVTIQVPCVNHDRKRQHLSV